MEKLLKRTTNRERFQAVCITPQNLVECAQLDNWSFSLTLLRWEAIYDFTHALIPLKPVSQLFNLFVC